MKNRFFVKVQSMLLVVCMAIAMLAPAASAAVGVPAISGISIDQTRRIITLTFAGEIAEARGITAKSKLQICMDGSDPMNLPIGTDVKVKQSSMVISLPRELNGQINYIIIPRGTLQNQAGVLKSDNLNCKPPRIVSVGGAKLDVTGKVITIEFDEAITGYPSNSSLGGCVHLARDGKTYDETISSDLITVNSSKRTVTIKLDTAITKNNARVKFDSHRIKSAVSGNINLEEIISPAISITSADAPVFKSSSVAYEGTKITFTFDRDIKRSSGVTVSSLKAGVSISRNGNAYMSLSSNDKVEISGNKLVVNLNKGLTGANNRLRIDSGILSSKDKSEPLKEIVESQAFNMDGTGDGGPKYLGVEYDASEGIVRIRFDREISPVSREKLESGVYYSVNGGGYELLDIARSIDVEDDSIVINLKVLISGTARFRIQSGSIMDEDQVKLAGDTFSDYVFEGGTEYTGEEDEPEPEPEPEPDTESTQPPKDTQDDANTQSPSQSGTEDREEDNSSITENVPVVTPPAGSVVENVVVALNGTVVDITDSSSVQDSSENVIYTVKVDSARANTEIVSKSGAVVLSAVMPTSAFGGTFSIPGDIMKLLSEKGGTVTVECAGASHYIPLSMISITDIKKELGVSDEALDNITVDIMVTRASNISVSDLNNAASKNSFTAIIPPTEFSIQYKSADSMRAMTKFDEFVEKSFVLSDEQKNMSNVSVVRVETSGKVNHVPSKINTRQNGDVCLTARTRQNGVYAVISANRTYSDTPTWAQKAVNALASRQILGDFTGSTLKPSQAATRAEVAGLVTKGMGIYTDKSGASKFLDVTLTDSYYISTAVAVEYQLINGYGDYTFKPEKNITRQEAAAILARTLRLAKNLPAAQNSSLTKSEAEALLTKFTDAKSVADWAKADMAECVQAGIINGDNNGRLNPNSNVTRAEIVQMVYNLLTKYSYISK